MSSAKPSCIWLFCGVGAKFPSGVFDSLEAAESWIALRRLSGVLTSYPVGVGVYDWAVAGGHFEPKRDKHMTPEFIQRFTSSAQPHHHFEDGNLVG